jgi:hypothetical protein
MPSGKARQVMDGAEVMNECVGTTVVMNECVGTTLTYQPELFPDHVVLAVPSF